MIFELWEIETRNVIATFDTEAAALKAVRKVVRSHGEAAVDTWLLMREDSRGHSTALTSGAELARRATKPAVA